MKIAIRGSPLFDVPLTAEHAEVLIECAAAHYDATCRAAGSEGFLVTWHRLLTPFMSVEPLARVEATWHELDCCLKILEGRRGLLREGTRRRLLADEMFRDFFAALNAARRVSDAWRAEVP